MEKKEEIEYNAKYANWNPGYLDLFEEITEIRKIQNKVLFDIDNKNLLLNMYYNKIRGLFTTLSHQVMERVFIQKQLDKIELELFKESYIKSVKEGGNHKSQNLKIYTSLRAYFQMMCESFSKNGLTMKTIKEQKDDPYNAVMRGYN